MDQFRKLIDVTTIAIFLVCTLTACLAVAAWLALNIFTEGWPHRTVFFIAAGFLLVITTYFISYWAAKFLLEPFRATWQAVLHVSQANSQIAAPDVDKLPIGRELTKHMVMQIYALASQAPTDAAKVTNKQALLSSLAETLPVGIVACNSKQEIIFANGAALKAIPSMKDFVGKNFNNSVNLLFPSTDTYENWLNEVRGSTIMATKVWPQVRFADERGKTLKQFDVTAYYNKGLGENLETSLILHDQTDTFKTADDDIGYVAMAVHELRTPVTIMRGYIEALEEELDGNLSPEMEDFLHRLSASAQQLSSFVSNILNVARIEENQLTLELDEQDWPATLKAIGGDMELRAKVRGKRIAYEIAQDIPPVAVDKVSIYEVIGNLIDNAIKYGKDSKYIHIRSYVTAEGMVETSVQDFGVGIPTSVMPRLFDKFYRGHRNRNQVGGTGLGLYLCKAVVEAHGGNVWVKSKEGEGSTFGFTLQPYASVADSDKNGDNKGQITRSAHGWIKNHSLYRR